MRIATAVALRTTSGGKKDESQRNLLLSEIYCALIRPINLQQVQGKS
jgi:hypothetical protein